MWGQSFWTPSYYPPSYWPKTGGKIGGHGRFYGGRLYNIQEFFRQDAKRREAARAKFELLASEIGAQQANELIYHRLRLGAEIEFQKAMNRANAYTILLSEV